ncbi:MAG: filamentous hemagglutinin N-terminal domain-containing protein [Rhizonema sp. PD37]|nr:filamentous hemagglutinin N-terminal domain-containing protein [Rhizonema sp. PD37]
MRLPWRQLFKIVLGGAYVLKASCATAQITPDRTLPNNSNVTINGSVFNITEGTQAGRNLFHSFQQFSVPTGGTASFNNGVDIQNIISRVTGGEVTNIDGLIRASGTANLFLINPNGIVFGQNARLDIGGSFVASTANSLKFADAFEFSATTPQTSPLLTISTPIGLQFGTNPGSIQVIGDGQGTRFTTDLIDTTTGLRVQPDQTLALVGGDLSLEGATLKTAGGRIELGSVRGNSLVSLTSYNKGFSLGYGEVQNGGNIQLSKQADVDASGEGGGDIQVWGRNVTLTDGSQIEASTLGSKPGGSLVVNAQDLVQLIGSVPANFPGILTAPSGLFTQAYQGTIGTGGDLIIKTHQLSVQGGAQVSAGTLGAGKGGSLNVTADSIQLTGISTIDQESSGLFAETFRGSTGDAGNLTIKTHQLSVQGGAQVAVSTFDAGKGGSLTVTADSIQLTGTSTDGVSPSGLFTQASSGSKGDAGNLTIHTHQLSVQNGASANADTFGAGKGGSLTVTSDSIQLTGTSTDGQLLSRLSTGTGRRSTGNAGNLTINTRELFVRSGATVRVQSLGTGTAGNLKVNARSIRLNNGTLNANTPSNSTNPNLEQATITLNSEDLILNNGSRITTNATGNNVIGGNIDIDTDVLATVQKSNISANSIDFRGGQVIINTQGLFRSPDTTITATGVNSQSNGTVQISNPEVDPSRGLVTLPTVTENTPKLISSSCGAFADVSGSNFTITGRGGLPPSPDDPLSSDVVWSDTRLPVTTEQHQQKTHAVLPKPQQIAIIPATGWVSNDKGEVTLISSVSNPTSINTPTNCPAR